MENLDKYAQDVFHQAGPMVYTTKNMEGIVSWWRSKDGLFAQADALVIVCTFLFAIQVVFGWWRRCSSNLLIKYFLWTAYTCTPLVATYTLGLINSFLFTGHNLEALPRNDAAAFTMWSLSLVFALGSTYSMTAYDVDENKQYKRHLIRHALYVLNTVAVIRFFMDNIESKFSMGWLVGFFSILFWPPSFAMAFSGMMASSSSDKMSLYFQDYMKTEHLKSTTYDPVTLKGYNYLIFTKMEVNHGEVTVNQVWASNKGILGSSYGTRLKEVCLSYALSCLLRPRFFGAAYPEATIPKMHDLVFHGLLSNVEENYQAAYRVIETELAFTHDHFFTTSPYFGIFIIVSGIGKVLLYLVTLAVALLDLAFTSGEEKIMRKDRSIVTVVIMLVFVALELLQLYMYLSSDFARVVVASRSAIPRKSIFFQIFRVSHKLPQLFGCWQNKIGQHSLLKDLHSKSITNDVMGSLSWIIFRKHQRLQSAFPRGICNPGVKGPHHTRLTCRVKKAIAHTLKSSDGHLSNGTSSLERNGQVQLSKEFLLGSHAGDMLIWHTATEYCDIAQSRQTAVRQDDFALSNRDVATRLSSYCAYLMAFVPELLPDHQLETTAMFHRTRKEAMRHLQKEKTLEQKYEKLSGNINDQPPLQNGIINHGQSPQQNENMSDGQLPAQNRNINGAQPASQDVNIFEKGIQLGKRLGGITDDGRRWKILADFWTEMILYIAPSNNARDHIQHLANGGEFLTHLWALLTHAGILERAQQNVVNIQSAGAHQPRQEHAQGLQPDQHHNEDTQNPVNHHEIEEETSTAGSQEADREAHVHGNGDFPNLPAQGNYDFTASSSRNNQPRVEIV